MKRTFRRITALLLTIVLTVSLCPAVYATDGYMDIPADEAMELEFVDLEPTDETEAGEEPDSTEAPDPTKETESTGDPDPTEDPDATEATESTEEPTEGEEDADAETEPSELPYGLTGMPEGYILSEAVLSEKEALTDVLAQLAALTPGVDYVENEVMTTAASEEEAALIAAAFNGEVAKFRHGMLTIVLHECTVLEAVTAAADMTLPLPAVQPNYITRVEPMYSISTMSATSSLPTEQTWESWVLENMDNPDEYLWDPYYNNTYQWHHDAVDTYAAWGVTTGYNVTVAVIDSGVDAGHEDLAGRVSVRDVGCGTEPMNAHGTHVAGLIAAQMDNGVGGAGIAPNANILSYCVAYDSDGNMATDDIIDAIYDAVACGAQIINMSYGGCFYSYYEELAINYAYENGVTCIAAMGNRGTNTMEYPAAYDHVIAVTATDRSNQRAFFSTYGNWSDVSAPGAGILSTVPGSYDIMDGTSMATPIVSGMAALYMSSAGWVSPDTMEKVLESSMENGVVNAAKMFRVDKDAPGSIIELDSGYYEVSSFGKNPIPCESKLHLYSNKLDETGVILYTLDGKTPSIKNGEVSNGMYYGGEGIDLSQFAGTTVTIKAARVTGMGVLSKVLTLRLKVAQSINITGVSVEGPDTIVAGKTGIFTAAVAPTDLVSQNVIWSIADCSSAMKGATIDKKGNLKTVSGCEGYVVIRAQSAVDGRFYCDKRVEVKVIKPVSKITVSATKISVAKDRYVKFTYMLWDANGNPIDPALSGVEFVSSNSSVLNVDGAGNKDGSGLVSGLKKGSASITIKALDGSKKTARITVTVTQPVESLTISGQTSIAPGASGSYKVSAYPSNATNKKVTWELVGAPAGVTISTSGMVKVPAGTATGTTFVVRARAADGYGAYAEYQVRTAAKSTGVKVSYDDYTGYDKRPVLKNGSVTSVELYTVDRPDYMPYDESSITLYGQGIGSSQYGVWSSNSNVVSIEQVGNACIVRAVKPGTARLTCTMQDGSSKRATVTIKVVTPASRVSISTTAPRMTTDTPFVSMGKSISFKATLADTYGAPSNKKVTWGVEIYETKANGTIKDNAYWTNLFLSKRLVSISGGKLTVKKGVLDYWADIDHDFKAVVYCYDAYGNSASQEVYLVPPTTVVKPYEKTVYMPSDWDYVVYFETDQWNPDYDAFNTSFVATSSNPKVVGVGGIYPVWDDYGRVIPGLYQIILASGKPGIKGRATITIKAADSGKSATISVTVDDKYR